MSRDIGSKASVIITEREEQDRKTDQGKLIFTAYKGQVCALLLQNNRLKEATFLREAENRLGAIYIGKIKNVVKNIDACFVEIAEGEICFLPMKNASQPYLLNRSFDGRLLEGDELLVQVEREAQKTKQASVTAHICLSNDYFVVKTGSPRVCYSEKLDSSIKQGIQKLFTEMVIFQSEAKLHFDCLIQNVRNLLSEAEYSRMEEERILYDSLQLPPIGCIVRTKAAEAADAGTLLSHFYDLTAQFVRLLHTAMHRSCFSCLKKPPSAIENILNQFAVEDEYQEIVTDIEDIYLRIQQKCQKPLRLDAKLRFYQDRLLTLSKLYSLDSKLEMALGRRVWLKSGGYLVIEPTEALTVIDVNSGKYEDKKDTRDAYLAVNLEAAEEIALQMRLRNLSGIIVVDFINMKTEEDRQMVLNCLRSYARKDRIKTTIVDMTPLGLVEITRKKVNRPLSQQWAGCMRGEERK